MNWDWEKLQEKRQRQTGGKQPFEPQKGGGGGNKSPFDNIDVGKFLPKLTSGIPLFPVIIIFALIWIASGIFIVDPGEVGVVTRFGLYNRSVGAGPHIRFPYPIENSMVVNVQILRPVTIGLHSAVGSASDDSTMFTGDENIIHMQFNVQYNLMSSETDDIDFDKVLSAPEGVGAVLAENGLVANAAPSAEGPEGLEGATEENAVEAKEAEESAVVEQAKVTPVPLLPLGGASADLKTEENARKYLFNVKEPDRVVAIAAEAAMREVVGSSKLDNILKFERDIIQNNAKLVLQNILDEFYDCGIRVQAVQLLDVQPPMEVIDSYKDIASAREDMERMINEARAYQVSIEKVAKGTAISIKNEAEAYSETVVRQAVGESGHFLQQVEEYNKAPNITEKRLRLEALQEVLSSPNIEKILLNSTASGYLPFLNLDRAPGGSAARSVDASKGGAR